MSDGEILVKNSEADTFISNLNTVYTNLEAAKQNFSNVSSELVYNWQGNSGDGTTKCIEEILNEFDKVNEGLKNLIGASKDALANLNDLDETTAKSYSE